MRDSCQDALPLEFSKCLLLRIIEMSAIEGIKSKFHYNIIKSSICANIRVSWAVRKKSSGGYTVALYIRYINGPERTEVHLKLLQANGTLIARSSSNYLDQLHQQLHTAAFKLRVEALKRKFYLTEKESGPQNSSSMGSI